MEKYLELTSDIESRGPHFPLFMPTEASMNARFAKDGFWSDESGTLLIVDNNTDRLIGNIVCFKPCFYHDSLEIGYILFKEEDRGKGYTTEATKLFIKYLFDFKPIHRIQLQIEPGNLRSQAVAKKCGFKFEGLTRQAFVSRGVPCDIGVYSLLRSEFDELSPTWFES